MSARAMSMILLILVKYLLCSNCTHSFCLHSRLFSDSLIQLSICCFPSLLYCLEPLLAPCQLFLNLSFQSFQTKHAACSFRASGGTFIQYVCCPSCHSLYQWKECIIHLPDNQLVSKQCSFQRFPNHPQHQHRHGCGQSLMKIKIFQRKAVSLPSLDILL